MARCMRLKCGDCLRPDRKFGYILSCSKSKSCFEVKGALHQRDKLPWSTSSWANGQQGQYGQHNAKDYKCRPVEDVDLIVC